MLRALAPLPEKLGAVPAPQKMAKVAKDLKQGVQKVSCDLPELTHILPFPRVPPPGFAETYLDIRMKLIKFQDFPENRTVGNTYLN